jgi:murein DD-endopeptidase MepM/ murein hydrolase activator NlpD
MATMRGTMRGRTSRGAGAERTGRRTRVLAAVAALALLPAISVVATPTAAHADEYPTWQDVQNATSDVKNAEALAKQVEAQIAALQTEVNRTQAEAEAKGAAYQEAQDAYDQQVIVVDELQGQAESAAAEAASAQQVADRLLSQLGKPSGGSLTAGIIADPGKADELLYRIGAMQKLTESSSSIYSNALQLKGTAESLTAQATEAETELDRRATLAKDALAEAQAAAESAQVAYDEQAAYRNQLEAQLTVLRERRSATEADYQKGVAERAAAAAAAAALNPNTGWARPAGGVITSGYGMRYHPTLHYWRLHGGTDLSGGGCGGAIYAAHAGTVTYAGPAGENGNYVELSHGNGIVTSYSHIMPGGILVRIGQTVTAGQNIAKVGTTGASTGCHLHYAVRVNGSPTDPVPFMRNQGMPLG